MGRDTILLVKILIQKLAHKWEKSNREILGDG